MPFQPGHSGNPAGRPKGNKQLRRERNASLRRAWIRVANLHPDLIEEAMLRNLESHRSLGVLELAAKLMHEIGAQEEHAPKVIIQLSSNLDFSQLGRAQEGTIIETQTIEPKALSEGEFRN